MTNRFILESSLTIGAAATALALWSNRDADLTADDLREAAIARQEMRVDAARASAKAKPLIGESGLPAYDAKGAVAREEAQLRRLSSAQRASR